MLGRPDLLIYLADNCIEASRATGLSLKEAAQQMVLTMEPSMIREICDKSKIAKKMIKDLSREARADRMSITDPIELGRIVIKGQLEVLLGCDQVPDIQKPNEVDQRKELELLMGVDKEREEAEKDGLGISITRYIYLVQMYQQQHRPADERAIIEKFFQNYKDKYLTRNGGGMSSPYIEVFRKRLEELR